jgi:serine/threonine protein kinase
MSPESIERPDQVDARSDLYAVGAVGYFLLTGTPVFYGQTVLELLKKQAAASPELPSQRLGKAVSADLELVLMKCLAKSPEDRPQSARELGELLEHCDVAGTWTTRDAEAWWDTFERTGVAGISVSPTDTTGAAPTDVGVRTEIHAS